jgi:hypothetical protein
LQKGCDDIGMGGELQSRDRWRTLLTQQHHSESGRSLPMTFRRHPSLSRLRSRSIS